MKREVALSSNADLSELKLSSGTLSPVFSAETTSYTANNVSAWATSIIIDCLQMGITSGRSEQRLEPKALISRAEVVVMIQRLLQLSELI